MINKSYTKTGRKCRVTFKLPKESVGSAEAIHVLGDFNGWARGATVLERRKNGSFSVTASLDSGGDYRFRYLVDGATWVSDGQADGLVPNRFGDLDSVVTTRLES